MHLALEVVGAGAITLAVAFGAYFFMSALGPVILMGVNVVLRIILRRPMDNLTLKECQWWHKGCRERVHYLSEKRRQAATSLPGTKWTPHDEMLLACYERLVSETGELANLLEQGTAEKAPKTAS